MATYPRTGWTPPVVHPTPKGARIDLGSIYFYEADGDRGPFIVVQFADEQAAHEDGRPFTTQRFGSVEQFLTYITGALIPEGRAVARRVRREVAA